MKVFDVIIIGAGPAGIITGVTAKKQYPNKTMLMIRAEEKGLVPCGIPYVFHDLDSVEQNIMQPTPFMDLGGEVITNTVTKINSSERTIELNSGEKIEYNKLVLATGSQATLGNFIDGYTLENVFYVKKSYNYIKDMAERLNNKKDIVIIGGGFIGAEVAEQLSKHTDKHISIIEKEKTCFVKAFSPELSKIATEQLEKTNVTVYTSTLVKKIIGDNGKVIAVELDNKKEIKADAVIISVGYKANSELGKEIGLHIKKGAIVVDNYGRTSIENIYAVGDCSQTLGFLTGRCDNIMLASTATAEARTLGYNLFGIKIKNSFTGTIAIFSTEINGLAMASAGVNEKDVREIDIDIISAKFTGIDRHPGAIKDASPLTVKLYVAPSNGSILGGEVWGGKSAGEIINTIGLAIQKDLTIYEILSFQIGTHPLLTGAPTIPVFIKAAEVALSKIQTLHN